MYKTEQTSIQHDPKSGALIGDCDLENCVIIRRQHSGLTRDILLPDNTGFDLEATLHASHQQRTPKHRPRMEEELLVL